MSECALWIEGPTWLSDNAESGSEEFNNGQLPQECLDEMKAGDKEKWKFETSSLLVAAETIGIAKVMTCEDYSNLHFQFVKILKSRLQKNVETQKEMTSQGIEVAETHWIKEIQRSHRVRAPV